MPSSVKTRIPGAPPLTIGDPVVGGAPTGSTLPRASRLQFSENDAINEAMQRAFGIMESDPNLARADVAHELSVGTLAPIGDEIRAFGEEFANSPRLAALFEGFEERASPDFSVVSDPERSAIELQLAQGLNRARQSRAAALRSRGLAGSGLDIENDPMFSALGSVGLGQISAGIATADSAAQERALNSLTSLTTDVGRFQGDILRSAGSADQFLAASQKDVPLSSFDELLEPALAEAFRRGEIELDRFEDIFRQQQEESKPGIEELLSLLLSVGTGFPGFTSSFLSGIG